MNFNNILPGIRTGTRHEIENGGEGKRSRQVQMNSPNPSLFQERIDNGGSKSPGGIPT
jgi:hypothetical protein